MKGSTATRASSTINVLLHKIVSKPLGNVGEMFIIRMAQAGLLGNVPFPRVSGSQTAKRAMLWEKQSIPTYVLRS